MKKGLIVTLIILGALVALVGCPAIGYHNKEVSLRNAIEAQQDKNHAVFDRCWKTISQQANVTSEYRDSFQEIYIGIMEARYADSNHSLANWVHEANPDLDPGIYRQLMTTIEATRKDFEREQSRLIDIGREHDKLLERFPGNMYLAVLGRESMELDIVTSSKTDEAFETGEENEIELFGSDTH